MDNDVAHVDRTLGKVLSFEGGGSELQSPLCDKHEQ